MPFLNWYCRMGNHEAVHDNKFNRIVHWICIPCQIFATFIVFTNIEISPIEITQLSLPFPIPFEIPLLIPLNLSLLLLLSLTCIYSMMDIVGGLFTLSIWSPLLFIANWIHQIKYFETIQYEILIALGFFIITFSIQIGLGHNVFEEGRDDTEQNIAELIQTFNPVYISIIPFYHHMEILFNLNYNPKLYTDVMKYKSIATKKLMLNQNKNKK